MEGLGGMDNGSEISGKDTDGIDGNLTKEPETLKSKQPRKTTK